MRQLSLALLMMTLPACSGPGPYAIKSDGIPKPLTKETPSADRGKTLFTERGNAHCILCHEHALISAEFQGNLGPNLTGLGNRLTQAQIRLRIVDYDAVKPGTTMPSYFRTKNLHGVDPKVSGQTVLSALEIEDIIAFLVRDENEIKP